MPILNLQTLSNFDYGHDHICPSNYFLIDLIAHYNALVRITT